MRGSRPATVYVHVYDLHQANSWTHWAGMGAYHCGVEISGVEYTYAGGAGIFCMQPKMAPGAVYRETIVMGTVADGQTAVARAIEILRPEFGPDDYSLINKNCNHFADRFVQELLGKGIPGYCNRLAFFGSFFSCILPRELTSEAPVNQDPNASGGLAGYPPGVGRYNGGAASGGGSVRPFSGEGMRVASASSSGGAAAAGGGGKPESEAERREKVRQATLARMAAASGQASTNGNGAPS